jgi:bifunctional non-homologous end joining protein LigD
LEYDSAVPRAKAPAPGSLEDYRRKRDAGATPEPFGAAPTVAEGRGGLFVVHQHGARRLHFDLRLEWGGVLHSWAVPKGPSLDPAERRFAVEVEDHPLEYGDFEGVIPEGNYGAGPVILWDRGRWLCDGEPRDGHRAGKLLFELRGHKLRGVWTLVRTGKRDERDTSKNWLLIKKPDAFARTGLAATPGDRSVVSGLTVEDLRTGADRGAPVRAMLEAEGAPKRRVPLSELRPMLAEPRERPMRAAGWLFELKYDGFRLTAAREDGNVKLLYRRGRDATSLYPEIAASVARLPFERIVLDGELVVLDAKGYPDFHALQRRAQLQRARDIERAAVASPATMIVFDLLALDAFDLLELPLSTRKRALRDVLPPAGALRFSDHVEEDGEALYAEVQRLGLEGIVGKRAASPYRAGMRHADWVKVRALRSADFIIVGFTLPKKGRGGFGALHVAAFSPTPTDGGARDLVYAGRVGSGFDDAELGSLRAALDAIGRPRCACTAGEVTRSAEDRWVEPRLVCEVRFLEIGPTNMLRQPVFLRLREDKGPEECTLPVPSRARAAGDDAGDRADSFSEGSAPPESPPPTPDAGSERPTPSPREVRLVNLKKVFWPGEGYTKGDLIEYYREVAPFMLPYLRERPLVLTRYPDGIEGKSFFQKDAPAFAPKWLRTEILWSEHAEREIRYFICEGVDSLVYIANMGAIPLHVWASRVTNLASPDWCVLDLDPKGAPFVDVVRVALEIRKLCDEIELPSFVKTSGSTGLHVLVPLGRQCTFAQARAIAELLAKVVVARAPDAATIARALPSRGGRVYIDWVQNGHGRLLVAPYSARPVPGATVSAPIEWREVGPKLSMSDYTIRSFPKRLAKRKRDPLLGVLSESPDLVCALGRLAEVSARSAASVRGRR